MGLPIGLSGFPDGPRRAEGGAGLITVEIAAVEPQTCPQAGLLRFADNQRIPAFSLLVDTIHEAGATLQLTDRVAHTCSLSAPRGVSGSAPGHGRSVWPSSRNQRHAELGMTLHSAHTPDQQSQNV